MADREQHNGRMLFTDFDASDKGRPVAVFGGATAQAVLDLPPPPAAPNVPSLDDIAASLGFAFEDDGDDAPPPPPPGQSGEKQPAGGSTRAARKMRAPTAVLRMPPGGDSELVLDDAENLKKKTGIHVAPIAPDAPAWDAMTSAYAQARPVGKDALFAAFAPARQETRDDDAVDVLSMLDEYLERENRSATEAFVKQPVDAAPFPEARHIPYGGIERVDDWFAPPEKEPETLQRVEDWFAPPEDRPDSVMRADNWYEPPEPGAEDVNGHGDPGATKVDISWLSDFRNELPAGEYWRKKTTRILKSDRPAAAEDAAGDGAATDPAEPETDAAATAVLGTSANPPAAPRPSSASARVSTRESGGARPAASDTAALFSGMDFDTIWERKVASEQRRDPAAAASDPAGETRRISIFDDIDIDGLWDKKQRRAAKNDRAPQTDPVSSAPPSGARDAGAGATIIVPQEAVNAAATVILRTDNARPPDPEAPDVPDELDAITAGSPDSLPRRGARAEDAPPEAPDEGEDFDVDALVEEAADMDFGGTLIDGDRLGRDAAGGEARDYVARTPPAEPPRKKGLSTDDLLNDIDLDSFAGGAGDISAPVIDDSAIDDIPKATRTGTAEMRAVAEGDDAGEEQQPVAVNPMDVFADMDNMDFSDDVDDDMRAMMEDEEAEGAEEDGAAADAQAGAAIAKEIPEVIPATRLGKAWWRAGKLARRHLPMRYVDKALGMVAWRENWWFYCDLVAAVVASASLAVIISYFFWYRGV